MKDVKPMLAGKCTRVDTVRYPVLVSPKLDGIRAIVLGGRVLSRKLELIPNLHIQKLFGKKKYEGLDGELMVGAATNAFLAGTAGIMKVEGKPDVTFHVFDDFTKPHLPFMHRFGRVQERADGEVSMASVPHHLVRNKTDILRWEEKFLELGYEGLMIRATDAPYKFNRSTEREGWLLKLKRFEDSEAEIVGYEELEHNRNEATRSKVGNVKRSSAKAGRVAGGVLGAMIVRDVHTDVEFNIGSGFTADQRHDYWQVRDSLLGKLVKYRYFPTGSKERPRFPTFQGFRDRRDM